MPALYLRDLAPNTSPSVLPETTLTNLPGVRDFKDYGNSVRSLSTEKGSSQTSISGTTQAHTDADAELIGVFCSPPLAAQTISGSPFGTSLNLAASTSDAGSNSQLEGALYVYRGTSTLVGIIAEPYTNLSHADLSTSETIRQPLHAPTSDIIVQAGDYLVLEVWRTTVAQDTSTGHTTTLYFDGTSVVGIEGAATSDYASNVFITSTLTFGDITDSISEGAVVTDSVVPKENPGLGAHTEGAKFGDTMLAIPPRATEDTVNLGDTQAGVATQALGAHTEGAAFGDAQAGAITDAKAISDGAALGDSQVVTITTAPPSDNVTSVVEVDGAPSGFQDVNIFFDQDFPVEVAEISPVFPILTARETPVLTHRVGLRMPVDQAVANLNTYGQGLMWGGISSLRFELGEATVTQDVTVTAYLILDPFAPTLTTDYVFGAGADRRSRPVYDVAELGSVIVPLGRSQFDQFSIGWDVTTDEFTAPDATGLSRLDRMNSVIRSANWIGTHLLFELRAFNTVFTGLTFQQNAWGFNFTYDPTFDTGRSLSHRVRSAVSRVDRCPVCGFATLREDWIIREGTDAQARRRVCPRCWDPAEPPLRILGPATPPVNEDN